MKETMTTIIGISLGTRSIGIAVLKDGELLDWKVHSFKGYWSKSKCSLIAGTIAKHIKLYRPDAIALKTPAEARPSRNLRRLVSILSKQITRQQLPLYCYTLTDLKTCFGCDNRQMLIVSLTSRFPELTYTCRKVLRYRNGYYDKAFEAVAATMVCAAVTHP